MDAKSRLFPAKILLVEDNPGDVRLVTEAINVCQRPIELEITTAKPWEKLSVVEAEVAEGGRY